MVVVPLRIVKVSVPSLRPCLAGLVMVALSGTVEPPTLKVAEALAAACSRRDGARLMIQGMLRAVGEGEEVGRTACRTALDGVACPAAIRAGEAGGVGGGRRGRRPRR